MALRSNRRFFGPVSAPEPEGQLIKNIVFSEATGEQAIGNNVGNVWTNVTGLSASITPQSISSKIYIFFTIQGVVENSQKAMVRCIRSGGTIQGSYLPFQQVPSGSELVARSKTASGLTVSGSLLSVSLTDTPDKLTIFSVDNPQTENSITYSVQVLKNGNSLGNIFINRGTQSATTYQVSNNQVVTFPRAYSSIMLVEVQE